jgi:hypothetical protein
MDKLQIIDLPENTCFICEKPFIHRNRYWTMPTKGIKEVEMILCHPICRSQSNKITEYKNRFANCEIEKKGHSREVRELNKQMKEINNCITEIEYKMFLMRYS